MFFVVASLIALLTLVYLVASGFIRVVRYFWSWLSSGEKINGATGNVSGAVSDTASDNGSDAAIDVASPVPQTAPFSKPKPTQAELSAYLDTMHLGWYQVVILFIVGCMAGLLIEEIWMLVTAGLTESRVGLIWGPFSPLYGTGAVFLTVICYQLHKHHANNLVIFLVSVVVGGTLEQLTGWGMQEIFHSESWTYAHLPDAITQWVAWRFLGFWGILGLIWCRVIMPRSLYKIGEPTSKRQAIFVTLLTVYLVADITMTVACLGRKAQRDAGIPPSNAFEVWVDNHYDDSFVSARFQNMTFTSPDSAGKS